MLTKVHTFFNRTRVAHSVGNRVCVCVDTQDQALQDGGGAMVEKAGLGAELAASGGGIRAGLLNASGSGGCVVMGGAG